MALPNAIRLNELTLNHTKKNCFSAGRHEHAIKDPRVIYQIVVRLLPESEHHELLPKAHAQYNTS